MNTPPNPSSPPPLLSNSIVFEPLTEPGSPACILQALLKRPGQIVHTLFREQGVGLMLWLLSLGVFGIALYGVLVGAQSGGSQMAIAPAKLGLATILSMLICLPSLYIFSSLDGIDADIRGVCGTLFAAVCLSALLLVGFAPVAWIFSQSTDSIVFMGVLHLLFWAIGIRFGLRLISAMKRFFGARAQGHLQVWTVIFVLVCLQMLTSLRPIIAKSDRFLPGEKKFFLAHWAECMWSAPNEPAAKPKSN